LFGVGSIVTREDVWRLGCVGGIGRGAQGVFYGWDVGVRGRRFVGWGGGVVGGG